jgi:hypothetical protein
MKDIRFRLSNSNATLEIYGLRAMTPTQDLFSIWKISDSNFWRHLSTGKAKHL